MIYENVKKAVFLNRPNRFIANVELEGEEKVCHVKNTGRCKELLICGTEVFVQHQKKPERKTEYDLIAVKKGDLLINMDSQAPNKVFFEWLEKEVYFKNITFIKPECRYKNSRFDFYIEYSGKKAFIEVKGVTLENNGILMFPDAPTERGLKHINELCLCKAEGYEAYVFFVIQTEKAKYFTPNKKTHKDFADALILAKKCGVGIKALNCKTKPDFLEINEFVEVRL